MYVTRQIYYTIGEHNPVVEIVSSKDDINPDMLVPKYKDEGIECEDPTEAVEIAIRIRDAWISDGEKSARIEMGSTLGGSLYMMDEPTDKEIRELSKKMKDKLPKCDYCGETIFRDALSPPLEDWNFIRIIETRTFIMSTDRHNP